VKVGYRQMICYLSVNYYIRLRINLETLYEKEKKGN